MSDPELPLARTAVFRSQQQLHEPQQAAASAAAADTCSLNSIPLVESVVGADITTPEQQHQQQQRGEEHPVIGRQQILALSYNSTASAGDTSPKSDFGDSLAGARSYGVTSDRGVSPAAVDGVAFLKRDNNNDSLATSRVGRIGIDDDDEQHREEQKGESVQQKVSPNENQEHEQSLGLEASSSVMTTAAAGRGTVVCTMLDGSMRMDEKERAALLVGGFLSKNDSGSGKPDVK
jgi:hypothetical protein